MIEVIGITRRVVSSRELYEKTGFASVSGFWIVEVSEDLNVPSREAWKLVKWFNTMSDAHKEL